MTILSCQKRHHEPHLVADHPDWEWCDGLPQWPYARPKPPRINDVDASIEYSEKHAVISVYIAPNALHQWRAWWVDWTDDSRAFHTHTEAIQYAQNLVNERSKTSGN